jgi:hypothetical protein
VPQNRPGAKANVRAGRAALTSGHQSKLFVERESSNHTDGNGIMEVMNMTILRLLTCGVILGLATPGVALKADETSGASDPLAVGASDQGAGGGGKCGGKRGHHHGHKHGKGASASSGESKESQGADKPAPPTNS